MGAFMNILSIPLSLSLGFILGITFSPLETLFHELGHLHKIKIVSKRNKDFKEKLFYKPHTHAISILQIFFIPFPDKIVTIKDKIVYLNSGFSFSNYYQFLQDTKPKYLSEIKSIAFASFIYPFSAYATIVIISVILSLSTQIYLLLTVSAFFLLFSIISIFAFWFDPLSSDRQYYLHPETYKYNFKQKVDD